MRKYWYHILYPVLIGLDVVLLLFGGNPVYVLGSITVIAVCYFIVIQQNK